MENIVSMAGKMIITVITDTSGSMSVMAKNHVACALTGFCRDLTEINGDKYSNVEFNFVSMPGDSFVSFM